MTVSNPAQTVSPGCTSNTLRIREATPADRDAIVALDQVAQSDPARIRFIERVLGSATCLVAERHQAVAAYVVLEYSFYEQGFVPMLYVDQRHRRHGLGRALLQAIVPYCETPKLFTSTNQSNQPMQQLLDTLGYSRSGIVHNLDPGDPELIYLLSL